jgi:hypothetical protein
MIHIMWPWLHTIILLGIWVAFWFIPDPFFDFYVEAGFWLAGLYLILQIIILIDFFHRLNETLTERGHFGIMLAVTIALAVLSLGGYGLSYWQFSDRGGDAIAVITISLIVSVSSFVLAILIEHGSIFTASLVAVYASYLTFSGLMCGNPLTDSASGQSLAFVLLSSIFTLAWVAWSATSAAQSFTGCTCPCTFAEEDERPAFSLSTFHTIFALASVYMLMLVTHWAQADPDSSASWAVDRGRISKWINLAAGWVTQILYLWTLAAPFACPDRDFS